MRLAATLIFAVACWLGALALARRLRPRPLSLSLPLAWAVLVAYQGASLPLLSRVHGVGPLGLLLVNLPLALAAPLALVGEGSLAAGLARAARRAGRGAARPLGATLLALAALIVVVGAWTAPNTWDGMTYHLARVVHWLQNGSVGVYQTWIPRQNFFPPGAEYLLLLLQALSGSDRLAFVVQAGCWATAVAAAPSLARAFGAPRAVAPAAALLVATLPMAVLQAASTQNDLVATVLAMAVVVAALPLAHRRALGVRHGLALGLACGAAWLVKATALVAAAPFAAWALGAGLQRPLGVTGRSLARAGSAFLACAALALLPEWLRRMPLGFPAVADVYKYPLLGEWADRAGHPLRALAHHLPVSGLLAAISPGLAPSPGAGGAPQPFRASEDFAGNPAHLLLGLAAVVVAAVRWRALPRRSRAGVVSTVGAWLLLHVMARENAYFARLETPVFALAVVGLGALAGTAPRWATALRRAAVVAAVPLLLHAVLLCVFDEMRPLVSLGARPRLAYYERKPRLEAVDDATLAAARALGCRRLGVRLQGRDPDPWEYPLLWRARQEGIAVEHVGGDEDWPCMIQSLGATPTPRERWRQLADLATWVRAPAGP